jgi:hypothetical protein
MVRTNSCILSHVVQVRLRTVDNYQGEEGEVSLLHMQRVLPSSNSILGGNFITGPQLWRSTQRGYRSRKSHNRVPLCECSYSHPN